MSLSFTQSSVLQLMEQHARSLHEANAALVAKSQQILGLSTGVVGFVSALKINTISGDERFIVSLLIFYIFVVIVHMVIIFPRKVASYPLNPTWDEVKRVTGKSHDDYYKWLIGSYTDVVSSNQKVNFGKSILVIAEIVLMALILLTVGVLALSA